MSSEIKISIRAYAKQLHVDESAVRSAITNGKIKKGVVYVFKVLNGKRKKVPKIIASIATKEWGFVHESPKPQRGLSAARVADKLDLKNPPAKKTDSARKLEEEERFEEKDFTYSELIKEIKITPTLRYNEAIRRRAVLEIAREKMELEEKQGMLVRKGDVDKALFAIGDELKKKLLSIPARCLDEIRSASNKVLATNILIFEINQVLDSIASLNI